MAWTVSKVAKLAGVSVRTLHHYDAIGLVKPSGRTEGNYRLYARADLERLEQTLLLRELGFDLGAVAKMLDDPKFDRRAALLLQRRILVERAARDEALIGVVDRALEALSKGRTMPKEEMFEAFGNHQSPEHADEAKQRWGDTDAYKESARRTKRYTKADWVRCFAESGAIVNELAMLAAAGHAATDPECVAVAEKHRLHIDRWFYPCPHAFHRNLGEMYVADERFAANYEKVRPGLTIFLRDAIVANAERPFVIGEEKPAVKQQQQFVRRK